MAALPPRKIARGIELETSPKPVLPLRSKTQPTVQVPVADRARLLFLADSIHTRFEGVADVRFTSSRKDGKTFISLQDVPMTELVRLTQALQDGMEGEPTLAPPEEHTAA